MYNTPSVAFNRTIVELKYIYTSSDGEGVIPFNRTIVELKHSFFAFSLSNSAFLLIVP